MEFNEKTQRYCPCCGKIKQRNSFYQSLVRFGEVYPLCKECCAKKYKYAYEKTKNRGASLWYVLQQLDIPMLKDTYDLSERECGVIESASKVKSNIIDIYYKNYGYLDNKPESILDSELSLINFISVNHKQKENREEIIETLDEKRKRWDNVWGAFSNKDCEALDNFYKRYTGALLEVDVAQELRYRDLCKAELRKRKIDEGQDKNTKDSREVTDEILKLMKLLKIDDFKDNKQSEIEKFVERMAWKIENEEPAECEDLQKYKDISGFEKTWNDILRCVKNLVAGTRQYPNIPKEEK